MTEQALNIFKIALLGVLYAFFARVLWAVWTEVRPAQPSPATPAPASTQAPAATAPSAAATPTTLVAIEPPELAGHMYTLDTPLTIGREPTNRLPLPNDTFVSGYHARVVHGGGTTTVTDLGSTNGTLVNGTKITQIVTLQTGDRIQLGTMVLEARDG